MLFLALKKNVRLNCLKILGNFIFHDDKYTKLMIDTQIIHKIVSILEVEQERII